MFIIFTNSNEYGDHLTVVDLTNHQMAVEYADSLSEAVQNFRTSTFDYGNSKDPMDCQYTITDTEVFDDEGELYGTITYRFDSIESLIDQYPEEFI